MLRFQETAKHATVARYNSTCSDAMIARRYTIQRKLGNGSFGSVYLVSDRKAKHGEELKVLKEISVGDLKPNETVEANMEAQLLSKLDHPAIVKFYASFVERDSFCIITEYCEGGDLDLKIQEYKESGRIFTQRQILDWFIQLLLGVDYMHERRILHRDLKAKNIFLKNNLLKIGDFGVSCLLMGSCDLATTFTGTPYYMSPEALKHQGYNTKSDIWSLGCILYEMCCMNHAFTGHNFLSVVLKIVEGDTPSLPDRYPSRLNAVLCSMLNKDPSLRPAAAEILRIPYIDEQLKNVQYKFTNMTVKDKALHWRKEAAPIFDAVHRKVHLQTLQELSEVQKMTPRERMRLRKLNAADEKAKKLKQLAEEKYQENIKRMQEFRSRNFQHLNVNVLHESDDQTSKPLTHSQPVIAHDCVSLGHDEPSGIETSSQLCMSELTDHEIPEDPEIAEEYYNDEFESCSEGSEEQEEDVEVSQTVFKTNHQDSDIEAMVKYLESVLNNSSWGSGTVTRVSPGVPQGFRALNSTMAETKLKRMREDNDCILAHPHSRSSSICAALQTHLSENKCIDKQSRWHQLLYSLADLHALPSLTEKIQVCRSHLLAEVILLRSATGKLGAEVFEAVYSYLKQARQQNASEEEIRRHLEKQVSRASDCFEVDQLLYFEEQLQTSESHLQL